MKKIPLLPHAIWLSCATLGSFGCSRPATSHQNSPAAAATSAAPTSVTPSQPPAKFAHFKFATQTLTVPEGFTVELVAGPPAVNRPISIAFDEQGRLYATDSSGLSERADKQFEQKPHRVVRLEDADNDGRFEKSTVFAENMMFPQGAMFYEGSLYVGAPPHIWKLTDTNDDGVSDDRVAWYDGKTLTGCANDLHGPYLGLDGWFYWTKGASAEQTHVLPNGKRFVSRAAHIFRSHPQGGGEEPVLTGGMDNPVGVAFTATGERILSGTFFQIGTAGKRDGLIHSVYGGVYGKEQPSLTGHPRTGDLMPIMTHMGAAAPCGSTTYRSRQFGTDYAENIFVCYFNLRKISRHQLVADGATFKTIDTDFVTSDSQDFRPTDVLEDADGSLLVVDTGGWYKICCPTSQLAKPDVLGAIYRIRKTGAPKIEDPRGLKLPWATATPPDLAKLLSDERSYVQQQAVHVLGKRGAASVAVLAETATKSTAVAARRNAVWALARIDDASARTAVRAALRDADASVIHTAIQVISLWRDAGATDALIGMLTSEHGARVRMAAEALGRIGDARAIDALLGATTRLGDPAFTSTGAPEDQATRILEHSLIYALLEIGRPEAIARHLKADAPPRVLRAALVALDQMSPSGLQARDVIGWLDSKVPMLKQTAGWIVTHHPDWGGELAEFFRKQFTQLSSNPSAAAELQTQLTALAASAPIQEILMATAGDPSAGIAARLLALRAMAGSKPRETPARWHAGLATLLSAENKERELTQQAVATVRALPPPKGAQPALSSALARVGRNAALTAEARLDALVSATPAALAPVDGELFDFLRNQLNGKEPMLNRGAAATVLAKAPLSGAQQLALTDVLKTVGALEAPKLLPAFEKAPNEALGLKLVAALKQSPGLPGIRANALKPLFAKYPASVQQQGDEVLTLVNADASRQNARVDELLAAASAGDVRRGQAVFNSEKTACSMCHVIGHAGGRLGPDLTGIGKIRNDRELLEAIVFPSATFVRGFEPFTVSTKSGETHGGIIRKDAADEVILATGPQSEQRIARADVVEITPAAVSQMPPGMDAVLSKQELLDLVAFLKSRQ